MTIFHSDATGDSTNGGANAPPLVPWNVEVPPGKQLSGFAVVDRRGVLTDYFSCPRDACERERARVHLDARLRVRANEKWLPASGPYIIEPIFTIIPRNPGGAR